MAKRKAGKTLAVKAADRLAKRIAAELFTNGYGEKAERLVLLNKAEADTGGWAEDCAARVIAAVILKHPQPKSSRK